MTVDAARCNQWNSLFEPGCLEKFKYLGNHHIKIKT